MITIGADFHPEFQQIALDDADTGELEERRLHHPDEAEEFYRGVVSQRKIVRVGMEASGHARWFERLMGELRTELSPAGPRRQAERFQLLAFRPPQPRFRQHLQYQ